MGLFEEAMCYGRRVARESSRPTTVEVSTQTDESGSAPISSDILYRHVQDAAGFYHFVRRTARQESLPETAALEWASEEWDKLPASVRENHQRCAALGSVTNGICTRLRCLRLTDQLTRLHRKLSIAETQVELYRSEFD